MSHYLIGIGNSCNSYANALGRYAKRSFISFYCGTVLTSRGHLDFENKRKEAIIVYHVNPREI